MEFIYIDLVKIWGYQLDNNESASTHTKQKKKKRINTRFYCNKVTFKSSRYNITLFALITNL